VLDWVHWRRHQVKNRLLLKLPTGAIGSPGHLPVAVVSWVSTYFIDYLGIALRASSLDSSKRARALARELIIPGQATLLGLGTTSADWAALTNGMAARSITWRRGELNPCFAQYLSMKVCLKCSHLLSHSGARNRSSDELILIKTKLRITAFCSKARSRAVTLSDFDGQAYRGNV
jgi:hypothetical protein